MTAVPWPTQRSQFLTDDRIPNGDAASQATAYAKPMFWPNVGLRYLEFFTRAVLANRAPFAPRYRRASVALDGDRQPEQLVQGGR